MTTRYASLHSGLLARKGEALPAGPTRLAAAYYAPEPVSDAASRSEAPARLTPPPPPAEPDAKPRAAGEVVAPPQRQRKPAHTPATANSSRRKTTVRLSADQHRRLRIAAAQLECSQQSLISEALETLLDQLAAGRLPDCSCLKAGAMGDS